QRPLVRGKPDDRVQRGGLACAVGTDQPNDAALLHFQVHAVQSDSVSEYLAKTACFDACHWSALLFFGFGLLPAACAVVVQQFFWLQTEPEDGLADPWPLCFQEFLTLRSQQQIPRSGIDEHSKSSFRFDESLVDQFLVRLQNRERI